MLCRFALLILVGCGLLVARAHAAVLQPRAPSCYDGCRWNAGWTCSSSLANVVRKEFSPFGIDGCNPDVIREKCSATGPQGPRPDKDGYSCLFYCRIYGTVLCYQGRDIGKLSEAERMTFKRCIASLDTNCGGAM